MKQLLGGLFAAYVVELVLSALGVSVGSLAWAPGGAGFAPWQLVTRFAVQGNGVIGVLIELVVAWFVFPALIQLFRRDQLAEAVGAMALVGTALPLVADLSGVLAPSLILGWGSFVIGLFVLFGLAQPDAEVRLYFVLPVSGRMIVWGTLIVLVLMLLAAPVTASLEPMGVWLGAWAWWNYRGPGARRRNLKRQAHKIERELRSFQVIEGGRSEAPQGDQDGDGWIH